MFGSPPTTTSAFGSSSSSTTTPAFGSSNAFGRPATGTSAFGSTSTTPFGGGASSTFGAAPTFGAPSPFGGGFGSASSGFGSNVQQQQAPTTFGGSTTFGTAPSAFGTAPTSFAFGSPTPTTTTTQPSMFGGSTTTTTNTSPFGGGGGGIFGSNASSTTTASPFGVTPTTTTTTSTFGAPAAPSTNIFGAPSAFGSTASTPLFGSTATSSSTTPGLFGSTTTNTTAFGAPTLFGSPTTTTTTTTTGTTAVPYTVTRNQDNNTTVIMKAITAMPAYETKSFEELRMEDYMAGNKGTGTSSTTTTTTSTFGGTTAFGTAPSTFGTTTTAPSSGGLFGSTTTSTPLFGSNTPSSSSSSAFGSTGFGSTTTFGTSSAPTSSNSFGFGSPAPAASTSGGGGSTGFSFGSTTAPAPSTFSFGAAPAPPSTGLFGTAAPAPTSLFGGTTSSSTAPTSSIFGSSTSAPTNVTTGSGGLFGSTAPSLFGSTPAPTTTTTGLFGSTTPATFGSSTGFGAPPAAAPPTTTFGSTTTPGLFGSPSPGGFFGSTTTTSAPTTSSLFGSPSSSMGAPAPSTFGGFFGATAAPAPTPTTSTGLFGGGFSTTTPAVPGISSPYYGVPAQQQQQQPTGEALLAERFAALEEQKRELAMLESWTSATTTTSPHMIVPTSYTAPSYSSPEAALLWKTSSATKSSTTRIRPRGLVPNYSSPVVVKRLGESSPIVSPTASLFGSTTKRLVIQPGSLPRISKVKLQLLTNGSNTSPATMNGTKEQRLTPNDSPATPRRIHEETQDSTTPVAPSLSPTPASHTKSLDLYKRVISSASPSTSPAVVPTSSVVVPKLTKNGYYVSPSLDALTKMSEADLAAVSNFVVSRPGYGSVAWEGAVDVRGVDLDIVVVIEDKEVAVYDDYEELTGGTKPPVGSKLNRPACITLEHVFPTLGTTEEAIAKFERKIAKQTAKMGADLLSYDSSSGLWKFRAHHFSRYGFIANDDEDSDDEYTNASPSLAKTRELALIPGITNYVNETATTAVTIIQEKSKLQPTRFSIWDDDEPNGLQEDDDEDFEMAVKRKKLTSKKPVSEEQIVLDAADSVYQLLISEAERLEQSIREEHSHTMINWVSKICRGEDNRMDEFETETKVIEKQPSVPRPFTDISTLLATANGSGNEGISAQIAKSCNVKTFTSSAVDFGMRMGRSFRVAWKPDGTFLQPAYTSSKNVSTRLVVRKPSFHEEYENYAHLLEVHQKNSLSIRYVKNCPLYVLPNIGGTKISYKALCCTIDEYANTTKPLPPSNTTVKKDPEIGMVAHRSFTLLSTLYGQETDAFEKSESYLLPVRADQTSKSLLQRERRREGLIHWLRDACAYNMQQEISTVQERNSDTSAAIFVALSGGDIHLACSLATENGFLRLATLLSMFDSGFEFRDLMRQQIEYWKASGFDNYVSDYTNRIYSLLSGSLEIERTCYYALDWRRRLCLHTVFSSGVDITVEDSIREFDADVRAELAPAPLPRYAENVKKDLFNTNQRCVLYNLLCMHADGGQNADIGSSLVSALCPLAYSASRHDYSLSFHLNECIQALRCAPPMGSFELFTLKESFCAQLLCAGLWHWAVYVMLCDGEDMENHEYAVIAAKKFVLRHFQETDESKAREIRSFLEDRVRIPGVWFEEALAMRCGYEGKVTEHVRHSIACSQFEEACRATEELIIPRALLNGGEDATRLTKFLRILEEEQMEISSSQWCAINGCGAVLQFLVLSKRVYALLEDAKSDPLSASNEAQELLEVVDELKKMFVIPSSDAPSTGYWACRQTDDTKDCVKRASLVAACNKLELLRLQLISLQSGVPIRIVEADFTLRSKIAT